MTEEEAIRIAARAMLGKMDVFAEVEKRDMEENGGIRCGYGVELEIGGHKFAHNTANGVCGTVTKAAIKISGGLHGAVVTEMWRTNSKFSKGESDTFPVAAPEGYEGSAGDVYFDCEIPMWSGEYGENRRKYLEFIVGDTQ